MTTIRPSELAADLLAKGHSARLRAVGGSMRPWMRPGTMVTLVPIPDPATLRVGEVVLAVCEGRPMLHRIVQTRPGLRTKGDALGHLDPPPSAILGRVEGSGGVPDSVIARLSLALCPTQRVWALLGGALRSLWGAHGKTDYTRQWDAEVVRREPRTLARNLFLHSHLAAFLGACADADVPVIVLKGAALAETVYPRLGLREFRDLDILVRADDAPRAREVLERLGYAADETHWQDLSSGDDGQADFAKQTTGGPVVLELHTDLLNNDLLKGQVLGVGEGVWQRAQNVTLAGMPAHVLGPEDQLLHLCLHLAGHYMVAPRSLSDIARVCAEQTIDWSLLVALARQRHMTRITNAALWLAVRLFGAAVSPVALTALAPFGGALVRRLSLARALDLAEHHTHGLRLPLLLLLSDRPQRLPFVLRGLLFPRRRWLHDHYAPLQASAPWPRLYAAHVRTLLRGGRDPLPPGDNPPSPR